MTALEDRMRALVSRLNEDLIAEIAESDDPEAALTALEQQMDPANAPTAEQLDQLTEALTAQGQAYIDALPDTLTDEEVNAAVEQVKRESQGVLDAMTTGEQVETQLRDLGVEDDFATDANAVLGPPETADAGAMTAERSDAILSRAEASGLSVEQLHRQAKAALIGADESEAALAEGMAAFNSSQEE
jgi:hypothetical protein